MAERVSKQRSRLIARLVSMAEKKLPAKGRSAFINFLRLYYAVTPIETLQMRSPEELLAVARGQWEFGSSRKKSEPLVRVYTPNQSEHGWTGPCAVVETIVDDIPFLVDSLSIAVRNHGSGIDWLTHPVMTAKRSSDGKLKSVTDPAEDKAGVGESFVHAQFAPLGSKAQHDRFLTDVKDMVVSLRAVVNDYEPMQANVAQAREELSVRPKRIPAKDMEEADAFLEWLLDGRFTFLGYCEVEVLDKGKQGAQLATVAGTGLGLLRDDRVDPDSDAFSAPSTEISKYAQSPRVLVVTKGNSRSTLHHDEYMDVVAVKRVNKAGRVIGVHRFVGLFSVDAYATSPRLIPVLRRKVDYVMERSKLRDQSHAAKNLRDVLETLPRDELFQSSEEQLYTTAMGIWALKDLQQLRLFMRRDRYGRFYSCMVYMPRDRYSRQIRDRMTEIFREVFQTDRIDVEVNFLRGGTARAMFTVRTPAGTQIDLSAAEIEALLLQGTRSWNDQLREVLTSKVGVQACSSVWGRFRDAFNIAFTESVSAEEAAEDVLNLDQLSEEAPVLPRLIGVSDESGGDHLDLKLYVRSDPLPLSDILPTLENFGLHVESQRPFKVEPKSGGTLWIQDFDIHHRGTFEMPEKDLRILFEDAFLRTWKGQVENDGINKLVLGAGLNWRQASLLRTICKYLLQTGLPFSQSYIEQILADNAAIARDLVDLFETRFTPGKDRGREGRENKVEARIAEQLDAVSSLDADRVLRGFVSVIDATLRTNYYQDDANGETKSYISIKLDPKRIPELPKPLPMFETFVYAPEVEGVHLRGGKVARGGLRWSDRREDFRTEVLGLMKAQMVKNAVIVPVGAKGGFVVKKAVDPRDREAFLATGIACYKTFLSGILDVTDNLVDGKPVPPKQVVRRDPDDPYLVVAADKGTATFSDIANGVSADYGYWLGDAFASGGSAGYDHKKMGITARGAWESVKRHFHEMGRDCQSEDFTVAGIGDMGGDVFGNGMLLSRHIKLVAAFNHMHIFLDPDPDPAQSFIERERMFYMPRSSWEDYDKKLISKGGGIYSRTAKSISISSQMRKVLNVSDESMTPNQLMNAILKAPVDLLWNGGIGTYVKSTNESHLDVGDRANDAIRVNGKDLRCKVVGEGGNLGLTQLGRIEFALRGGRINTDAIDNSGGVNSSDREVNIKIPLNELMAKGEVQLGPRNRLLSSMTRDLEDLVLYDNYVQSQAISLIEIEATKRIDEHANLMRFLERDGLLERAIEFLPDEEQLSERRNNGGALTRPEISVLLSYSKISLYEALLASKVPDDSYLESDLLENFPKLIRKKYTDALTSHRLRREIVATILTNLIVNRMGMAFAHRLADEQGATRSGVVLAFTLARSIFNAERYWKDIEKLDGKVSATVQYRQMSRVSGLLKHVTTWMLANASLDQPIEENVARYADGVAGVEKLLPGILPPSYRADWNDRVKRIRDAGIPDRLSTRMANTQVLGSAVDIVELMHESGLPLETVAETYFLVGERFSILWMLGSIVSLEVAGRWQALARATLRDDTYRLHRLLARSVLRCDGDTPEERLKTWSDAHGEIVQFGLRRLNELQTGGVTDFLGLSVAVRELRKFRLL